MSEKKSFGLIKDSFVEGSEDQPGGYDEMLPGGICHYDGPEADLPLGGYTKVPGWGPEKAAKKWIVADPEADLGYSEKKTKELSPDDIIIGVELNQALLEQLIKTYGPKFYLIREANGGPFLSLAEWQTHFGTDGFGLVAIRNMRQILAG